MPEASRPTNDQIIFGLLREIRASCQYLQSAVTETLEQASKLTASGRAAVMDEVLGAKMLVWIAETIQPNLKKIDQLFEYDPSERDWCSDSVEVIRLNWLRVLSLWPDETVVDYGEQRQRLSQVAIRLDQIIYQCASLTLSPRATDILKNLRVGQPLDWDFVFGAELPFDPKLRKRLLEELAQEGGVFESAVVDVEQRLIYKVAKSRAAQRRSAFKLAAFILVCGIAVPLVLAWIGTLTDQWPLRLIDLTRLYVTYVLIFIGAGAHVAIEALKAQRRQTRPSFQAMNDWILWVHVRYISILWGGAWVLLGYVLLSVGMPRLQWQAAFFAGYSIDSITALFLARFETTVKAKTQELPTQSPKPGDEQ